MAKLTPAVTPTLVSIGRTDLCLAFANTRYWRGSDPPTEELHGMEDVLRWSETAGALDADAVRKLGAWWRANAAEATAGFAEAMALREAIFRLFAAAASGAKPAAADLALLNAMLRQAPKRTSLQPAEGGYAWEIGDLPPTVAALLTPVLWSAGDLLAEPLRRKVRQCANDRCLYLFLDDSKGGTRRWCAMSMCGNRAKAHRHYLRRKQN